MSILATPTELLPILDDAGRSWSLGNQAINLMMQRMRVNVSKDLQSAFLPSSGTQDPTQYTEWQTATTGVTTPPATVSASGAPLNNGFGGTGLGGGSFGNGQGLVNVASLYNGGWAAFVQRFKAEMQKYGKIASATIVDGSTYAGWFNNPANSGGAAFSTLYSPDWAAIYYWAYAQLASPLYLAAANGTAYPPVFAPQGMQLATFTISAANTGTASNNASTNWPTANGYATPAPSNTGPGNDRGAYSSGTTYAIGDAVLSGGIAYISLVNSNIGNTPATSPSDWAVNTFGYNLYLGNMPMAQAFAPLKSAQAHVTTNINGPCPLTVTAPAYDSSGVFHAARLFTATLDNDTAGTIVQLTPTVSGDRMYGVPIAICVAGDAMTFTAAGTGAAPPSSNTSGISNPASAPSLSTSSGSSTFTNGETVQVGYTYLTAAGETEISPLATQAITVNGQNVLTAALTGLPAGITGIRWYVNTSSSVLLCTTGTGPATSGVFNIESGTVERTIV